MYSPVKVGPLGSNPADAGPRSQGEAVPPPVRGAFAMGRDWMIGLGAVLAVAGIIFTLQGLGDIGGSVMSGVTMWAVIGPILAVIGLALAGLGFRRRAA